MDKLIITVACDSSRSFPENVYMPARSDIPAITAQYIDAFEAGASVCHHHGVVEIGPPAAPGEKPPMRCNIEGWAEMTRIIREACPDVIIQYGIAGVTLEDKELLIGTGPDMMSTLFGPHDSIFQSKPEHEPFELVYAYPRQTLAAVAKLHQGTNVRIEGEIFGVGYFYNLEYLRGLDLLPDPAWATMFFGWKGVNWVPPTVDSLTYLLRYLPPRTNWGISVQDPAAVWPLVAAAIGLGGHIRIGWEDNPYLPDGELAENNRQLVENVVNIAHSLGREVASPAEARQIIGLATTSRTPANVA